VGAPVRFTADSTEVAWAPSVDTTKALLACVEGMTKDYLAPAKRIWVSLFGAR